MAKDTVLNIKTVQKVVNQLIDLELVADTGKKMGTTNKVRVLKLVGVQSREQNQNRDNSNEPKKGLVDKDNEPKNGAIKHTQKGVNSEGQTNPILEGNEPKNGIVNDPN
ncbi:helix-turn-helix domain-containing protein, partial [Acinetobacter guillouiae]